MAENSPFQVILYWSKADQRVIAKRLNPLVVLRMYEEAIVNVQLVIEEWIETAQSLGRPIPKPKGRLIFA